MDAYEGKTVHLKPVCPLCEASMEQGYMLDRGDSSFFYQEEGIAGEPVKRSRWIGGVLRRVLGAMPLRRFAAKHVDISLRMPPSHSTMFDLVEVVSYVLVLSLTLGSIMASNARRCDV